MRDKLGWIVAAAIVITLVVAQRPGPYMSAEGSLSPVEWDPGDPVSKDTLLQMEFGDLVLMKDGRVLILESETPDRTSVGLRDLRSGNTDLVEFLRAELLVKGKRVVRRSDREDYNGTIGDYLRNSYRPEP